MNNLTGFVIIFGLLVGFSSCEAPDITNGTPVEASVNTAPATESVPSSFADTGTGLSKYWYQGKGELNVYELEQNRYQGVHRGQALLIFVTEDFLLDKQVKNESYRSPAENNVPIFKMNGITRFTTGLYDYSIMTSVFTPVDTKQHPRTLKVTNSSQDWCGHSYAQINTRDGKYHQQLHSYFEREADAESTATANLLEDEIFSRIRMDYRGLPTGDDLNILPSQTFLRLRHQPFRPVSAKAGIEDYNGSEFSGEALKVYTLEFPDFQRTLRIIFSTQSPYKISGWTDTYPSAFDGVKRSTKATLKNTVLDAYWNKNANSEANVNLRTALGWK